jgi:hypothetical protein
MQHVVNCTYKFEPYKCEDQSNNTHRDDRFNERKAGTLLSYSLNRHSNVPTGDGEGFGDGFGVFLGEAEGFGVGVPGGGEWGGGDDVEQLVGQGVADGGVMPVGLAGG